MIFSGKRFTWNNRHIRKYVIKKKLNQVLFTQEWIANFQNFEVRTLIDGRIISLLLFAKDK